MWWSVPGALKIRQGKNSSIWSSNKSLTFNNFFGVWTTELRYCPEVTYQGRCLGFPKAKALHVGNYFFHCRDFALGRFARIHTAAAVAAIPPTKSGMCPTSIYIVSSDGLHILHKACSALPTQKIPTKNWKIWGRIYFGPSLYGKSDLAKIWPLKVWPPAINWKSSLYENFHQKRDSEFADFRGF